MSEKKNSDFFGHFLYVFGSQLVVLSAGLVKALVIPVLLGLSDYGYWQIYIFYTIYIGVFTFGYGDGLYLKYGGYKLGDLPFERLRAANAIYLFLLAFGAVAFLLYALMNTDPHRQVIFCAIAVNIAVLGTTSNISLTLQAANLLKSYAFLNSADKIFFTLALLALFNDSFRTFEYLIAVDLFSKVIVMSFLVWRYRQLFIGSFVRLSDGIAEYFSSVGAGVQLLLANLSGMLVLDAGRVIVEYFGNIESYAHYAFAISLTNVVLMSVSALSIVIYPTLKRQSQDRYLGYFNTTCHAYSAFAFLMLTGYFPARAFVQTFAAHYQPMLEFLNVMFVITVLQGKMQLVNNTYYKALRLERPMLVANLSSLVIATLLAAIAYASTQSVLSLAYTTMASMIVRVYASEVFLRRYMGESFDLRIFAEGLIFAAFLTLTSVASLSFGLFVWIIFIASFALFKHQQLSALARQIRGWKQ